MFCGSKRSGKDDERRRHEEREQRKDGKLKYYQS